MSTLIKPGRLNVNVTEGDVRRAEETLLNKPERCPIECALERQGFKDVFAGYDAIEIEGEFYITDKKIRNYMRTYDTFGIAGPFEFSLDWKRDNPFEPHWTDKGESEPLVNNS